VNPLQVRLELSPRNARNLRTHAAQVLFLAARRNLIAKLRTLAADITLPGHGLKIALLK
jgi:hypothetical protein